jgi:hypothetical protein
MLLDRGLDRRAEALGQRATAFLQLVRRRRQVVGAKPERHAAERDERVLQCARQRLERLAERELDEVPPGGLLADGAPERSASNRSNWSMHGTRWNTSLPQHACSRAESTHGPARSGVGKRGCSRSLVVRGALSKR